MSTKETLENPKSGANGDCCADGSTGGVDGSTTSASVSRVDGSPIPTGPKPRKNPNYPNLNVGGTNRGGTGRPSERLRLVATKSLEEQIEPIGALLRGLVERADAAFARESTSGLHDGLACIREIGRLANTLTSIGPGTKVTNVVEREGFFDSAKRAYESHDGTLLSFLKCLKQELE